MAQIFCSWNRNWDSYIQYDTQHTRKPFITSWIQCQWLWEAQASGSWTCLKQQINGQRFRWLHYYILIVHHVHHGCLQLHVTRCNAYQGCLCFCSFETFRYLVHVLIYSTELNSGFMTVIWKMNYINCVNRRFSMISLCLVPATSIIFKLVKKVCSTRSSLDKT